MFADAAGAAMPMEDNINEDEVINALARCKSTIEIAREPAMFPRLRRPVNYIQAPLLLLKQSSYQTDETRAETLSIRFI